MQPVHNVVFFSRMGNDRTTVCNYKNNQHQNTKVKLDVSKADIAKQLQLFSMHSEDSFISVHMSFHNGRVK
jgi:hypothetical protein